jgi:hypothetical protein
MFCFAAPPAAVTGSSIPRTCKAQAKSEWLLRLDRVHVNTNAATTKILEVEQKTCTESISGSPVRSILKRSRDDAVPQESRL